jgi:hypothetical protein
MLRRLVRLDHESHVVPALDEVAERLGLQQHREVAEIAVLVGVDQPPPQRIVMEGERLLRGAELDAVPGEFLFGGIHVAVDLGEVGFDRGDVAVGDRQLLRDGTDPRLRRREILPFEFEFGVDVLQLGLLFADLFVEAGRCARRARGDQGQDCGERRRAKRRVAHHFLRLSVATNDPACFLAYDFNSAATSPIA